MKIRRMGWYPAVLLTASLAGWLGAGQTNDQAEVQLKAAMHRELADGDLKGAIEQYQAIIATFGGNRAVVAQALVQMGQCHEKLGMAGARSAYDRVVREFADQAEPLRLARQRLAALQPQAGTSTIPEKSTRRVWEKAGWGCAPTRDGRYLTFQDGSENLAVYEIATGQKRLLTNKDPRSSEFVMNSVPSPDGREVAYVWYNTDGRYELRIVGWDGSGIRVVYTSADSEVYPVDWSPDGRNLLVIFYPKDTPRAMALVSVADGSVRELKTFDRESSQRARFSPDGAYIAYNLPQQPGSSNRDIFLLNPVTGRETPLIQHPANDEVLDWTPDGKRLLFSSDRSGTRSAWCVSVKDGKPDGIPVLVKADLGQDFRPMGFAQNGSYYYGIKTQMSDVYVAELDFATGRLLAEPVLATQSFTGANSCPEWSDDGQQLLFLSTRRPGVWGAKVFCIRSTETGEVRELATKLHRVAAQWVRWSPDGRSVLTLASVGGRFPFCRIDVQTGDFEPVVQNPLGWPATWSRDSKAVFYHKDDSDPKMTSLVRRDLATSQDTVLHRVAHPSRFIAGAALSRDGRHLAFVVGELGGGPRTLKIMPAAGGEPRELLHEEKPLIMGPSTAYPILWLPDNQNLLFMRRPTDRNALPELWVISAQGGDPRKLDLPKSFRTSAMTANLRQLSIHPDGRHIAYTAGQDTSEVWVMENFLPPPDTPR